MKLNKHIANFAKDKRGDNVFPNLEAEQARHGQTNSDVAAFLNISRQSYEVKKKNGNFRILEAKALCELYGQDLEYLFDTRKITVRTTA